MIFLAPTKMILNIQKCGSPVSYGVKRAQVREL